MADSERLEAARSLALSLTTVSSEPTELLALAERLCGDESISLAALRAMATAIEGGSRPRREPAVVARRAVALRPDRSGRSGTHPDRSGLLLEWALHEAGAAGAELVRVGLRGQTFRSPRGRLVHVRTMRRHDRGLGRYSYWFGLADQLWAPGAVFMLVCDRDGIVVMPTEDLMPFKTEIAAAKDGAERQPNVWREGDRFELRASGNHVDLTKWVGRFDLL